jgi:hypothetical protein
MGFAFGMTAGADIGADDVFAKVAAVFLARPRRTVAAGMGTFWGRIFIGLVVFLGRGHVVLLIACLPEYLTHRLFTVCSLASLNKYFLSGMRLGG